MTARRKQSGVPRTATSTSSCTSCAHLTLRHGRAMARTIRGELQGPALEGNAGKPQEGLRSRRGTDPRTASMSPLRL